MLNKICLWSDGCRNASPCRVQRRRGDSTAASGSAVSELCVSARSGVDGYIVTCGRFRGDASPGSAGASLFCEKAF